MSKRQSDIPNETSEMWRKIKEEKKQERQFEQDWAKGSLDAWCAENGVSLREIAPHQFRLDKDFKKIDIFPQSKRWHNLKDNKRGGYRELISFITEYFKINNP